MRRMKSQLKSRAIRAGNVRLQEWIYVYVDMNLKYGNWVLKSKYRCQIWSQKEKKGLQYTSNNIIPVCTNRLALCKCLKCPSEDFPFSQRSLCLLKEQFRLGTLLDVLFCISPFPEKSLSGAKKNEEIRLGASFIWDKLVTCWTAVLRGLSWKEE